MDPEKEAYLKTIYYNPEHPASFSGLDKLYREIQREGRYHIEHEELKDWLKTHETYGVHRQRRRHFSRPMVVVSGVGVQADADLMDMSAISHFNDQIRYILVHIDDFSKYVRTVPQSRKRDVAEAFRLIFRDGGVTDKLRTDHGTEFTNKIVQNLFKEEGVHHFLTSTEVKAGIAERAIKTLKSKYFKYMSHKQTFRYIDIVDQVTHAYNHRYHRTIKMRPVDVTLQNEGEVWENIYRRRRDENRSRERPKFGFEVGDKVRVSYLKKPFEREYDEKWTYEYFNITGRDYVQNKPVYQLEDIAGDEVTGRFYPEELQAVTARDDDVYKIQKVLQSRKRKNHPKEFLVRWLGWPQKFDSWVTEDELEDIRAVDT